MRWLIRRSLALMFAGLLLTLATGPAEAACSVTSPITDNLGSVSPAALKAVASPYAPAFGSFGCTSSAIVTLLSGNYLKATVPSGTLLRLTSTTTTDVATYVLAADANGANPVVPGTPTYYVNGTFLNLLGTLAPGTMSVPIYVRPQSATRVAPGTYSGSFAVQWDWYFCSSLGVGSLCAGTTDTGSRQATINVSMLVSANDVIVTITPSTTWNPVELTGSPKAIPGGKLRLTMTVTNPDIVPVDANTLVLRLPTPAGLTVALDGDGATARPAIQMVDGSPPSTLTLNYVSSDNLSDDVDFLTADDQSGNYRPIPGDQITQASVTGVRLHPRGSMAAGSSFKLSVSYTVR